jgi:hypothetical protein
MTSPAATVLAKKLRLWFAANEPRPSPPPETRSDATLPQGVLDTSLADPALVRQLRGLRLFEQPGWDAVCSDMAVIIGKLSDNSRSRLVESLGLISAAPPVEPALTRRWLFAVNGLLPSSYPTAVMEFFQLVWMWEQLRAVAGMEIGQALALFFRAIRGLGEGPRSAPMIHFLLQLAGRWPARFCYWLQRTSEVGPEVIQALKIAEGMMPSTPPHAQETLLDFAAEMGWRFLDPASEPLWRAVGRLGEMLYRRLRGIAVSVPSMRLLSGLLGAIEAQGDLPRLLAEVRLRVVERMFGESDPAVAEEALEAVPEAHRALEAVGETELIVQVTAIHGAFERPEELGAALCRLSVLAGGGRLETGVLMGLLEQFQGRMPEEEVLHAVEILSDITPPSAVHAPETWFRIVRLLGQTREEMTKQLRSSVARVLEAVAGLPDPVPALELVEESLTAPGVAATEAFQAAALLVRAADGLDAFNALSKTGDCARLLQTMSPQDREWLLSSMPPHWLTALAIERGSSMRTVVDALSRLEQKERIPRFLDKVVTPLLEELKARGEVFEEYLTAAVTEYGRMPLQGQVRDTEHELLRRLFRTGDGAKAVESSIAELLKMPGLEGDRATSLMEVVKTLCSAFNRQAVWQDASDNTLQHFLERGLPRLIAALVDCPEALDTVSPSEIAGLVDILMPAPEPDADPQNARWQTRTGAVYFEKVFPTAIELFPEEPGTLVAFVESIAHQAMRSVQGLPAGAGYLGEVATRLEQLLIESYSQKILSSGAGGRQPHTHLTEGWALEIYSAWSTGRSAEAALARETAQVARLLSGDKKQQRLFALLSRKLWEGMSRAGLISRPMILRRASESLPVLAEMAPDLLEVFRRLERGEGSASQAAVEKAERLMVRRQSERTGENQCRLWRAEVFTPLGNCLVDMMMLQGSRPAQLETLIDGFLEVSEFLGTETGGEELLLALQRCLCTGEGGRPPSGVAEVLRSAEKQLFRPLWRRRAMSRIELLVAGIGNREALVDKLLDRIGSESGIVPQVRFLRRFGQTFLRVEEAIGSLPDKRQQFSARDSLAGIWLFSGAGAEPESATTAAREACEAVAEVFRAIRRRTGEITAAEDAEISAEMRKRYRDNADVVATLLRWTLDTAREPLLEVLESSPKLLEAASRDTELIHLLDTLFGRSGFMETVTGAADSPQVLKDRLRRMSRE